MQNNTARTLRGFNKDMLSTIAQIEGFSLLDRASKDTDQK